MATTLGWAAMLAAAVAALVCGLALRPRHPRSVIAMAVMLVAMLDMGTGHVLLPPIGWAAVLIFVGVFVVAVPHAPDRPASAAPCGWHHGLALVAAAVIMISAPHSLVMAHASGPGLVEHAAHPAPPGGGLLVGLLIAVGYATVAGAAVSKPAPGASGRSAVAERSVVAERASRLQLAQVAATSSCLALMALLSLAA